LAGVKQLTTADDGKLDPAVVAALYVDHGEQLRRFLLGMLRDEQLVNDVLQAAFTKAVEVGHTSQEKSRKAWLFRVAYNEAMAILRRGAVGDRVVKKLAWTKTTSAQPADEPVMRFETVEMVRKAMHELPAEQLQIVKMRIYEEKTFAEIAQELQIPLGTALARMRSATGKMRKKLQRHHED
jgi:RNA polymerase sigma factor (sigma-70 family)